MKSGGNQTPLDRLVAEDLPRALRFALRLTGREDTAEEVLQEALCRAARAAGSFRGKSQFRTWFFRIVISAYSDHVATAARHRCSGELPDELADRHGGDPVADAVANELQDIVAQRISALPSRQREVLLLTTYENMRPHEPGFARNWRPIYGRNEMNNQTEHADHWHDPLDRLLAEARCAEPSPETICRLQEHWQLLRAKRQWTFAPARKTRTIRRAALLMAAATLLACVWLGMSHFHAPGVDAFAFAETLRQIETAKTMTWTTVMYEHFYSKDGKRTWLHKTYGHGFYKAPGLSRTVWLDDKGETEQIEIKDSIHARSLAYWPKEKKAFIEETRPWPNDPGPFPAERQELAESSLQWIGKRKTASGEVNVFRCALIIDGNDRDLYSDNYFSGLTTIRIPG